jgi:hypothetical protein
VSLPQYFHQQFLYGSFFIGNVTAQAARPCLKHLPKEEGWILGSFKPLLTYRFPRKRRQCFEAAIRQIMMMVDARDN